MFPNAVRIFSVRGIDVRVDASWIVIALLVVWSFTARLRVTDDHALGVALPVAVLGALLFFGSVLVHELAHALEGRQRGLTIGGITLFLFGGVTETRMETRNPRDEFVLAAVGPYASLVLAASFGLATVLVDAFAGGTGAVVDMLGLLGWINLGLALFNLLPGAPLDGGRILRAALWRITGRRDRAARGAARAGQGLGGLVLLLGIGQILLSPAGLVGGLWLVFIGWFLYQAARGELEQVGREELLAGRTAADLAVPLDDAVAPDAPVVEAGELLARREGGVLAVRGDTDALEGLLTVREVSSVPGAERGTRRAAEAMRRREQLATIGAELPAAQAVDELGDVPVLVLRGDEVVGVLLPDHVQRVLERLRLLGPSSDGRDDDSRRDADGQEQQGVSA